jgi:hypothetical protein
MKYQSEGTALIVLAGREYGTGSSRDWAAKGTMLLGVKAVIAESFERIHRSNLIGMGVLPCQFQEGKNALALGLTGEEIFDFGDLKNAEARTIEVTATHPQTGKVTRFTVRVRIDTPKERDYYRHGGILQYVLRQLAAAGVAKDKPKAKAKTKAKPKSKTKAKVKTKSKVKPKTTVKAKAKTKVKAKVKAKTRAAAKSKTKRVARRGK